MVLKMRYFKTEKKFFHWFINIVLRTLKNTSSKKNVSQNISNDFTFHNQYIQLLNPIDEQLRLNLIEIMPNNIEFCTKSAIKFFRKKNYPEAYFCLKNLMKVHHFESCQDLDTWKTFILTIVKHGSKNELREAVCEMARAIPRSRKMWDFAVKIMWNDQKFVQSMSWPILNFLEMNINDFISSIRVKIKVEKIKE